MKKVDAMLKAFRIAAALLLVAGPAHAQVPGQGVQQQGTVTANDCVAWAANGVVKDTGAACGGAGTVTSVSVTTQNGVSGTVANPTTTPALAFTLGAITPSSAAIGAGSAITSSGPGGAMGTGAFTSAYTLPTATSSVLGGVKPDGTTLTNTAGAISVTYGTAASTAAQGGVITAGGPTGSATVAPIITYNAAGQLTTVSSATITPAVGSISGLGTGVATALGVNVGTAGAPVVLNGAGGTPSAITLTNGTGLPVAGVTGTVLTLNGVALSPGGTYAPFRAQTTPGNATTLTTTTQKMFGLAQSFTPATSGRIFFSIAAGLGSSATSLCTYNLRWGTGAAPVNGAAATGTGLGASITSGPLNAAGDTNMAPMVAYATGFAVSTVYWLDVAASAPSGTCFFNTPTFVVLEE